MSKEKKFLDYEGVKYLWSKINMQDYPNNQTLIDVINAIDETKADKNDIPDGALAQKDIVSKEDLENSIQTSLNKADTALQSFVETDPTVPDWAKAATKPTYTKNEVGLGNVTNESKATMFTNPAFTGTPVAPTAAAGTNTTQVATTAFVNTAINNLASSTKVNAAKKADEATKTTNSLTLKSGSTNLEVFNGSTDGSIDFVAGSNITLTPTDGKLTIGATIPTSLKNPKSLTVGSKTYDGSSAVSISASDLGLSNALHFIGTVTSLPSTGTNGDVVLMGSKEYVYSNGWVELGDGDSHALKTITISAGGGLAGGGDLTTNRTISHADTSSQASITASGRKYITGVTLDGYGHVTGLTTGTETVTNTDTTYDLAASKSSTNGNVKVNLTAGGSGSGTDSVTIKGSGATTVTTDANGVITINSTDNNTTYSAATQTAAGLMSAADKKKLDGIATGANNITIDSSLSPTSTNPVQNKVIKTVLDQKMPLNGTLLSNSVFSIASAVKTNEGVKTGRSVLNLGESGVVQLECANVDGTNTVGLVMEPGILNIRGLTDPINDSDAASKHYVDITIDEKLGVIENGYY